MEIKRFNISKPKKYMKGTEERTQWNTIGTITEFWKDDGKVSRIIEIPAIGLEANIFPVEPKNKDDDWDRAVRDSVPPQGQAHEEIPDDINPEDIPF